MSTPHESNEDETPRDIIVSAIRDQLKKEELQQDSNRARNARQIGEQLISLSEEQNFMKFSKELVQVLSGCFDSLKRCRTNQTKRDIMDGLPHEDSRTGAIYVETVVL